MVIIAQPKKKQQYTWLMALIGFDDLISVEMSFLVVVMVAVVMVVLLLSNYIVFTLAVSQLKQRLG